MLLQENDDEDERRIVRKYSSSSSICSSSGADVNGDQVFFTTAKIIHWSVQTEDKTS